MIKIFDDLNEDFESHGTPLKPLKCNLRMELNGLWKVDIEHSFDEFGRWKNINGDSILSIPMPNGKHGLFRVNEIDKDTLDCVVATARPIFYDNTQSILEDVRPTNKTVQGALNDILVGTRFKGYSDIADLNTSYYVLKNRMEAICGDDENSILNRWGKGEIYFDNFDIYVNERIGGDYGVVCEVGKNATVLKENDNWNDVITRAYVKMYDGLMLPEKFIDSPLVKNYDRVRSGVIEFNDIKVKTRPDDDDGFDTEEQAFEEARRRIKILYEEEHIDLPKVSYSADMITIKNTFKNINSNGYLVDLGDTITAKSKKLGVDIPCRAIVIEWDCITKQYINIDFSNEKVLANNSYFDNQNRIDSIFSEDNPSNVKAEIINGFLQGSKAKIVASKGIAEKQHTRVIEFEDLNTESDTYGSCLIGTNGLAVANQKTLDGKEWDYTTAVNARGIYANILYGKIFAGRNGYLDLENCDFRLGGDKATDVATMTNQFLEFKNQDGSLTRLDKTGIVNVDGETKRQYFFRKESGNFEILTDSALEYLHVVKLDDWYKGKKFNFDANINSVYSNMSPAVRESEWLEIKNIDYANAEVTLGIRAYVHKMKLMNMNGETFWVPIVGTNEGSSGGSGESGGSDGDWQNGIISSKGFRFIKGYEAYAPYKYQDSGGYWTIAYGVTAHGEADIYNELVALEPVSEEKAAQVSYDLKNERYGKKIISACQSLGVIAQHQFDALLSLAYNCGYGVITADNSLTRAIKGGRESEIRSVWEQFYITSNGVELEGLKLRRKAECDIFLDNNYEMRSIPKLNSSGNIIGTVDGDGWLPETEKSKGEKIVESARKMIGLPYRYGGNYPPMHSIVGTVASDGTDCSGLCQWATNDAGFLKESGLGGRWTTGTMASHGTPVEEADLKIGDFVLPNSGHVFIYSGEKDGKHMCVEAPRTGLNIREVPFTWDTNTVARRFFNGNSNYSNDTESVFRKWYADAYITVTWSVIA